jgi:hypothetical protein
MNQKIDTPIFLEYFNQGSDRLFFYKDSIVRYLKESFHIKHYQLKNFKTLKLLALFLLPIQFIFCNKKDLVINWNIICELSPRRYNDNFIKKLSAFLLWEFRFLHFKLVVLFIKPTYFLCTDSAFFLLRWMKHCKKKNIIVLRDFNNDGYCFSIIRDKDNELRFNNNFNQNPNEINPQKLSEFINEFQERLKGESNNLDYVLAHNTSNNQVNIVSNKIKVLLATHIFGDASSAHISMFKTFKEWTLFFINFFSHKTDDYLLIVKEHPSSRIYNEENLLLNLLGNSGFASNIIYIPANSQISPDNIDIVISGNGSIGHEYIYLNKPVFNTSIGFCMNYKGCYTVKNKEQIFDFFHDKNNIIKLQNDVINNRDFNLKMLYIFTKCSNLLNNHEFKFAIESNDYDRLKYFFDKSKINDFIFNPNILNHYFVLEPKYIS